MPEHYLLLLLIAAAATWFTLGNIASGSGAIAGTGSQSSVGESEGGQPGPVHRVFLDPDGKHCVITVIHPGGAETYYHHARWPRPKSLPRLRGLLVNAVAWNRQAIIEASTKEVILGTETGQIFEMAVDEADKKEKYVKLLFELAEVREGIKDLQMETAVVGNATRYYVMAVTPTRLYSFTGIGSLETVFASYSDRAIHFMELPGEIPNSELHFFIKQRRAKHFGWLSGAGIYYGELNFGAQHRSIRFGTTPSSMQTTRASDLGIRAMALFGIGHKNSHVFLLCRLEEKKIQRRS